MHVHGVERKHGVWLCRGLTQPHGIGDWNQQQRSGLAHKSGVVYQPQPKCHLVTDKLAGKYLICLGYMGEVQSGGMYPAIVRIGR